MDRQAVTITTNEKLNKVKNTDLFVIRRCVCSERARDVASCSEKQEKRNERSAGLLWRIIHFSSGDVGELEMEELS